MGKGEGYSLTGVVHNVGGDLLGSDITGDGDFLSSGGHREGKLLPNQRQDNGRLPTLRCREVKSQQRMNKSENDTKASERYCNH